MLTTPSQGYRASQGGAPHSLRNTVLALFFNGQLKVADDDNPILFVSLSGLIVLFLSGSLDRDEGNRLLYLVTSCCVYLCCWL
ncbi:hypothetical protein TNCV_2430461 [Trichonephila clavipes]|nr:hypothetical protein TNCV_2430461 [Trichonephila clavipes]